MNITEFLEGRIAEDEARARSLLDSSQEGYDINEYAERMLAECKAKREIIAKVQGLDFSLLEALAYVYKDHHSYDRNWRR
jgi:hypothetical protein